MRDFKGMKRQRGRNRGGGNQGGGKPQHNINRAFDSSGPENIKIRGHAQHVYEKYSALARDVLSAGDRVLGENYMQHAEHYFRTLRAIQPNRPASDIAARDSFTSGIDIDFEDEALETAMEEADAQAAERVANGGSPTGAMQNGQAQNGQTQTGQAQNGQGQGGQNQGGQNQGAQADGESGEVRTRDDRYEGRTNRYDRDQNQGRYQNDRSQGDRSQGDRSQGDRNDGDREFRRDRQSGDRQTADRQGGDRQNNGGERQNGEYRRDRNFDRQNASPDGNRDQNRDQTRDRGDFRRDRQDRGAGPDRQERFSSERQAEPAAVEAVEPSSGVMLRSRDGEESHAPAFLGAATPAPSPVSAGDDAAEPKRARTRTRRPRQPEGEAPAAAPETEEA